MLTWRIEGKTSQADKFSKDNMDIKVTLESHCGYIEGPRKRKKNKWKLLR